jgi:HAD superfamily hydrolase (TIGR01509 family)
MTLSFLFFDFGGCIDAPGIHTRTLFWEAFRAESMVPVGGREEFQEAYTRADQRMMETGEAKEMGLRAFNRHNAALIARDLGLDLGKSIVASDRVSDAMVKYIANSREALLELAPDFHLGIISNFTGNLEVILREFGLRELFHSVTESFEVGHAKPDPRIFEAALATQSFPPEQCLYIGDNPKNDIDPAKKLGLTTVLIGERRECGADGYVGDLRELPRWIASHIK